jgi:hypothetical protein
MQCLNSLPINLMLTHARLSLFCACRSASNHLKATNYEPLRDQLRSPAAGGLSSEEKLSLWRGLACHSFCRALGSVWLVPLMDLLVRLKLHIVGRWVGLWCCSSLSRAPCCSCSLVWVVADGLVM